MLIRFAKWHLLKLQAQVREEQGEGQQIARRSKMWSLTLLSASQLPLSWKDILHDWMFPGKISRATAIAGSAEAFKAQSASSPKAFWERYCPTPFFPLPHTTLSHFPSFRHTPTERAHSVFRFFIQSLCSFTEHFYKDSPQKYSLVIVLIQGWLDSCARGCFNRCSSEKWHSQPTVVQTTHRPT